MICHVWSMRMKPESTPEQRQAVLDALATLPEQIPGILSFTFGGDLGMGRDNADVVVIARFADEADWRAYLAHPAHDRFAEDVVTPVYGSGAAIQFPVDESS
ncbi:Dabb family protein [Embleya scabrispora]|uniref:Dabb family protein n=1 Tax=Embleya scabrispora TaxID=159449 RepID=UPI0004761B0B|nr:Dabb family protein [Embleya scabrispora]MYS79203.1 Dabb family protein [Streptomyces sp. SID5474]